jgi:ferric-dicitrate binding protein FerR (iron transport regulator)
MPYSETYIAHLLLKQAGGELTPEELLALQEWRALSVENAQLYDSLLQPGAWQTHLREFEEAAAQAALVQPPTIHVAEPAVEHKRVFLLRRSWLRYAAVLFIVLSAGLLLWTTLRKTGSGEVGNTPATTEIAAAGQKATLILGDGSVISLDSSTGGGTIAEQGNSSVVKTPDGEIRYEKKGSADNAVLMNTMRTPKGGQYRLTLPDGTRVWLNTASSVTYPTVFAGNSRRITMTGEAYFEVVKDKAKPFFVDINGEGAVEVLGTEFNINAYKDHGTIKTTLVTGKLRAVGKASNTQTGTGGVVLSPGQQAIQDTEAGKTPGNNGSSVSIADNVNMAQVLAWKNGIFDFTGANFQTLMKEVERWYDVDVRYEGAVPDIRFKGKMDRAVKLSGLIRFLHDYGVEAQLDGRTLVIK